MATDGGRLNVTLDGEHLAKLARLAQGAHAAEGTIARSLLSQAIDEADISSRNMVQILEGIPGAYKRAQQGLGDARSGDTVALDEL